MRLSQWLCATRPTAVLRFQDRRINRFCRDARVCDARCAFVCLRGSRHNGEAFAADAYSRGCRVFLSEAPLRLPQDATNIICENARKSAADILLARYQNAIRRLSLIGVTGTKGKTSVAAMWLYLLQTAGLCAASIGTLGVCCTPSVEARLAAQAFGESENTTPDLFFLAPLLEGLAEAGARQVCIEVSSQALAQRRIDGIPFFAVAVTAFGRDHIGADEHSGIRAYYEAKRRLFSDFGAQYAVYDADDPLCCLMARGVRRTTGVSLCGRGDLCAKVLHIDASGVVFEIEGERHTLALAGAYNLRNALVALALASYSSCRPPRALLPSLAAVRISGRFERIEHGGRTFVIDYAHNGMSVSAVVKAAREVGLNVAIAVFGSVGGRGRDRRIGLSKAAESLVPFSVITSDNPNDEPPLSICAELYRHFRDKTRARIVVDRAEAIRYAYALSQVGDTILLLGKGQERYQSIHGRRIALDEREVIASLRSDTIKNIGERTDRSERPAACR